jgi:lysophospholipase L1-like esterase
VRIGRTSPEGVAVLRRRVRPRHDAVVFDLGTNDLSVAMLARSLRAARRAAARRPLVTLTLNGRDSAARNRVLRAFARTRERVALVQWHRVAGGERLLAGDGVHASVSGYARRAAMVRAAVRRMLRPRARARVVRPPRPGGA